MQVLLKRLNEYYKDGKEINVFVIGTGFMGSSLVAQLNLIDGFKCNIIYNRTNSKAVETFLSCGVKKESIYTINKKEEYNSQGFFIPNDPYEFIDLDQIDVIVDATGSTYEGAKIAYAATKAKKHLVSLNVECDVVVGPILSKMAKEAGVCYTGIAGDEPGSVKELFDFAEFLGFEVMAIGKGKNNPLDLSANNESVYEEAKAKGLSPYMLATFVDGSKTIEELTMMCNATGFKPDKIGAHGIKSDLKDLDQKLRIKSEGGLLNNYKVADFVFGIAPGVFIMVKAKHDLIDYEMRFLKIGQGPYYILYRPFHLTSIEVPITIAQAFFYNTPTISPRSDKPFADTVAVAKVDLKAGDNLGRPGGKAAYGTITTYEDSIKRNLLPYGFISLDTILVNDIKKGDFITYDDVIIPESRLYDLRREMDGK